MLLRSIVAIVALIELVAPRKFINFWLALVSKNPDEVELRPWVIRTVRLEGLLLLGWVAWSSRDQLLKSTDFGSTLDVPEVEIDPTPTDGTADESADAALLREGTTRYDIASVLYHADEPLAVSELVELSSDSDWEVGRSTASATLYRMYSDGIVERQEREDGRGFEYWIADAGSEAIESQGGPSAPSPFETAE